MKSVPLLYTCIYTRYSHFPLRIQGIRQNWRGVIFRSSKMSKSGKWCIVCCKATEGGQRNV